MILYILDDNFDEVEVIDGYESLIWTERFDKAGDFELRIFRGVTDRNAITQGTILGIHESKRMMVVEKIEENPTEDGNVVQVYTGRSMEGAFLANRVGRSDPVGSPKVLLNNLVRSTLLFGELDVRDKFDRLEFGTNQVYPASKIGPSVEAPSWSAPGWYNLLDVHESSSSDSAPLGFRIIRDRQKGRVFYENYTGNDRTEYGGMDTDATKLIYDNPYFNESDKMVRVWTNLAKNPGMTEDHALFLHKTSDGDSVPVLKSGDIDFSVVDIPEAVSGKGWKLTAPTGVASNQTSVTITAGNGQYNSLGEDWCGSPWYGRKIRITVSIYLPQAFAGTGLHPNRASFLIFSGKGSTQGNAIFSLTAPNTAGHHTLSGVVFLPASGNTGGFDSFRALFVHGGVTAGESVYFYNFTAVDVSSVAPTVDPAGFKMPYFDGEHSFDPDLIPSWSGGDANNGFGELWGKQVSGVRVAQNCVAIQTSKWSKEGGVSCRVINQGSRNLDTYVDFETNLSKGSTEWPVRRVTSWRHIDQSFSQVNSSYLGTFETGSVRSSPMSNSTGAENQATINIASGSGYVKFYPGFTDFGKSIYIDQLVVSPSSVGHTVRPNEPVIFSEELDTFILDKSAWDTSAYRNVVYIVREGQILQLDDIQGEDTGLHRRVTWVNAESLKPSDGPIQGQMLALGRKTLNEAREKRLIDGTVPSYSRYLYDRDYFLGDVVSVMNRSGMAVPARVTEQIFVQDQEGFRTYPTLSEERRIELGTWVAPRYNIHWISSDTLGVWSQQP